MWAAYGQVTTKRKPSTKTSSSFTPSGSCDVYPSTAPNFYVNSFGTESFHVKVVITNYFANLPTITI